MSTDTMTDVNMDIIDILEQRSKVYYNKSLKPKNGGQQLFLKHSCGLQPVLVKNGTTRMSSRSWKEADEIEDKFLDKNFEKPIKLKEFLDTPLTSLRDQRVVLLWDLIYEDFEVDSKKRPRTSDVVEEEPKRSKHEEITVHDDESSDNELLKDRSDDDQPSEEEEEMEENSATILANMSDGLMERLDRIAATRREFPGKDGIMVIANDYHEVNGKFWNGYFPRLIYNLWYYGRFLQITVDKREKFAKTEKVTNWCFVLPECRCGFKDCFVCDLLKFIIPDESAAKK